MCFVAVKTIQLTMDTKEQIKYDSCVIDILCLLCVIIILIYKAVCISGGGGKSEVAAGL